MIGENPYKIINENDVKHSLDYISQNGEPHKHGILHIDSNKMARATKRCVKYDGKKLAIKEIIRAALFVHYGEELTGELDFIRMLPKVGERHGVVLDDNDIKGKYSIHFLRKMPWFAKEDFVKFDDAGREWVIGDDYVDEGDAGYEYEKREIKKVSHKHAEEAFDYILNHGKRRKDGMLYYGRLNRNSGKYVCDKKGNKFAMSQASRLAYLYALKDEGKIQENPPFQGAIKDKKIRQIWDFLYGGNGDRVWRWLKVKIYGKDADNLPLAAMLENSDKAEEISQEDKRLINLLKKFKQIIFSGPPGTGKTHRAKKLLPILLNIARKEEEIDKKQKEGRWDIVQFHPSYNYEDFVRGLKVETKGEGVAYETVNRIFGKMCKNAGDDLRNAYVLIIDEINRANVSAVLGELIYALEYRGKKIKTPYRVDDSDMLVVPNNLYIIGTMNTADRTIGQIDYAVRRRFAFIDCLPDEGVIGDDYGAKEWFGKVNEIFRRPYVSKDYNPNDVRIGHSYFLAKSGGELAAKIIYQVFPILREYLKDGILSKEAGAGDMIENLEQSMPELLNLIDEEEGEPFGFSDNEQGELQKTDRYYWEKNGKRSPVMSMRKVAASVIKDYFETNPSWTIEKLQEWFYDKGKYDRGIKFADEMVGAQRRRFFTNIPLERHGKIAYVTNQWGSRGKYKPGRKGSFQDFVKEMAKFGYTIRNIDETDGE